MPLQKQCNKCKEWKDLEKFSKRSHAPIRFTSHCKICMNLSARLRHNPSKTRSKNLIRKYGIGEKVFLRLLASQSYKCLICSKHLPHSGNSVHVDHDHSTGNFRGILCGLCNKGLGQFKDSRELLLKAATYLGIHGSN